MSCEGNDQIHQMIPGFLHLTWEKIAGSIPLEVCSLSLPNDKGISLTPGTTAQSMLSDTFEMASLNEDFLEQLGYMDVYGTLEWVHGMTFFRFFC